MRSWQKFVAPLVVATGVMVIILAVSASHDGRPAGDHEGSHAGSDAIGRMRGSDAHVRAGSVSATYGEAAIADVDCSYDAVPQLRHATDKRIIGQISSNPYSQVVVGRISRDDAIAIARQFSSDPEKARIADAAAAQVSAQWLGDTNQLINPARCFWVVTVAAPYVPRSTPRGVEASTYGSYTVAFDSASGEYLSTSAGADSLNVLTGHVPKVNKMR